MQCRTTASPPVGSTVTPCSLQVVGAASAEFVQEKKGMFREYGVARALQLHLDAYKFGVSGADFLCFLRAVGVGMVLREHPLTRDAGFSVEDFASEVLTNAPTLLEAWREEV